MRHSRAHNDLLQYYEIPTAYEATAPPELLCYASPRRFGSMGFEDSKATIHYAGNDLFVGISPSGHALTLDTSHDRASAPTPMELLLIALGSCTAVDVIGILQK